MAPRKYKEPRYRIEATIPLELLVEVEKCARDRKVPMSRTVEVLLDQGLKYYYHEREQAQFKKDLETVKELEKARKIFEAKPQ